MERDLTEARGTSRRNMLKISAIAGIGGALGVGLVSEAIRQGRLHTVTSTRTGLGTLVKITATDSDPARARHYVDQSFNTIEALEDVFSRHRAHTPVSTLNRVGVITSAPPDLITVLDVAQDLAVRTAGAFDVTMAPILELHAERYRQGRAPTPGEIDRARSNVGYECLRVEGSRVEFTHACMAITLDGIAKGYVVDCVVQQLTLAGYPNVLVDAGGDIGSSGSVRAGWTVAIQDPRDPTNISDVVRLRDGACVATSGDYMQAFTPDRTAHPIIDPRSGLSPRETSSATVLSSSVMRSDALSTAALVLGPSAGIELLESLAGVEGLIVTKDGTRVTTTGWRGGPAAGDSGE